MLSSKRWLLALVAACLLPAPAAFAMGARADSAPPSAAPADPNAPASIADVEEAGGHIVTLGPRVSVETSKGIFTFVTFPKEAPATVEQVLKLAKEGFYDGQTFHRVVPGFVVQTGDPASKALPAGDAQIGRGGSGTKLPPEFRGQTLKHLTGSLAMARGRAADSADSQFYVTLAPQTHLDGAYTIWGQVTGGMDVLRRIQPGDKIVHVTVTP